MVENIFRKKSLDRVSSPEQLDTYLKVTSPSVWLILSAIIVMLVGVIAWGYFGTIETKVTSVCVVDNDVATCYIKEDDYLKVKSGMNFRIEENVYSINEISHESYKAEDVLSSTSRQLLGITANDNVYLLKATCDAREGLYVADIIIESISPLKFVFN